MEAAVNNGICRCCASDGTCKDVKSTYHWMGEEEIYSDMLRDCFDISLIQSEYDDGGICEVCITQLRNASNFKKQVLHTEKQFELRIQGKLFKSDIVKIEPSKVDNEANDSDNYLSEEFSCGGEDFEVPIKIETDDVKPKKRAAAAKASTSRAKKAKANDGETSTKRILHIVYVNNGETAAHRESGLKKAISLINKKEKTKLKDKLKEKTKSMVKTNETNNVSNGTKKSLKKGIDTNSDRETKAPVKKRATRTERKLEYKKHDTNIREILKYSNATPIKRYDDVGYFCCYCNNVFSNPVDLKEHTLQSHHDPFKAVFTQAKRMPLTSYLVKLDITSLRCNLCDASINTLEQLMEHLINVHQIKLHTDIKNLIMPFKFDGSTTLRCFICLNEFFKFKILLQHMNEHYRNYICNTCDAGFVNHRHLYHHSKIHVVGSHRCSKCPRTFSTVAYKKMHERDKHSAKRVWYKCGHCDQKFIYYHQRITHLADEHNIHSTTQCGACSKTFTTPRNYKDHVRRVHLMMKNHKCQVCEKTFNHRNALRDHMIKHGARQKFECKVCHKTYARHRTVLDHMRRVHPSGQQYVCDVCNKVFVKEYNFSIHMASKHALDKNSDSQ